MAADDRHVVVRRGAVDELAGRAGKLTAAVVVAAVAPHRVLLVERDGGHGGTVRAGPGRAAGAG